ncbi:MAG: hypothetical protein CXX69_02830 [Candidatus Thalassarchaeum betae]|uniref:Uncharacterized protein n=1 Tax=Candidatus Thalassarchaeum betae TaxID=2599289 RepID=A0A2V3HVI1_9ARCH|nr:MAG: hypothetical protein CXX69_02830 [Candidatus Thalassoarchaea betae]PXF25207.1 MAG: hypothetical protein CXX70_08220 [Euryarchaeota archaeon]
MWNGGERIMANSEYRDEASTDIGRGPDFVFVSIGLFIILMAIGAVAFFGGFYVMDEWDSKDWPETEVLAIGQDYTADEGTQIFFYNYSVDGAEYNSTFSCDFNVHGESEQTQGGSGGVDPWQTQCLQDSEYYLDLESVAYNPDDPSEIDVYPGFTYRMIFEVYGPKLAPSVFILVGIVIALRGVFGPSFGPWAFVAGKIIGINGEITDLSSDESKE